MEAPRTPRHFLDGAIDPNLAGHGVDNERLQLSAYVLNLMCELSGWMHQAMAEGNDRDAQARIRQYQSLRQWSRESLPLVRADVKFRPEMSGLR